MSTLETTNQQLRAATRRNRVHPHKMVLYAGLCSLVMMFIALTSAFIVRRASGNWLEFSIPSIFYLNSLVIVGSSLTLHLAYRAFKREAERAYRSWLIVSFVLGVAFLVLQYLGWLQLAGEGVPLKINPAGDFVYAISGLHALHVIGGLVALLLSVVFAFALKLRRTPARQLRLELTIIYWHFVDGLWLYLILFLTLQR
jgi:cytochrome c oxidase subunit 3